MPPPSELASRVAARWIQASYFAVNDIVLFGKYKNKRGRIVGFSVDKWGNPTVEIEPIPKGRKQNKVFGLFRIWRADVKEKALAEQAKAGPAKVAGVEALALRVARRFAQGQPPPL